MPLPRFRLRTLMIAVAGAAVIAAGVEWSVIGAGLLVLVRAARRPQPVHRTTAILLTLLTVILLWANLRHRGWEDDFGRGSTPDLDPITTALVWRGWPLSPCMFCMTRSMRFHASGLEQCVLAFDGFLFVAVLLAMKGTCERCLRWQEHRGIRSLEVASRPWLPDPPDPPPPK